MKKSNSILIRAPKQTIFDVCSDLRRWPDILPHYRSVTFLETRAPGQDKAGAAHVDVIEMIAVRGGLPISWVSELWLDPGRFEIHFFHLKKFTKGMKVVWTMREEDGDQDAEHGASVPPQRTEAPAGRGIRVAIHHDLIFRIPMLAPVAHPIISNFIEHIAGRTLGCFKAYLESLSDASDHPGSPASARQPNQS